MILTCLSRHKSAVDNRDRQELLICESPSLSPAKCERIAGLQTMVLALTSQPVPENARRGVLAVYSELNSREHCR